MDEKIIINNEANDECGSYDESAEICNEKKVTEADIFEELKIIREKLTDFNAQSYLYGCIERATSSICESENENIDVTACIDVAINDFESISKAREESIRKLMDLYSSMLEKISK